MKAGVSLFFLLGTTCNDITCESCFSGSLRALSLGDLLGLVKIGLQDLPPVTFAGLRYFLAFLCLLAVLLLNKSNQELRELTPRVESHAVHIDRHGIRHH